ncbi:MAG: XRE family transcriptional regulator [Fimbriimonadaceae bacterium]|nr:XRE family transcriptional regulator [Alphaproteobacteria bacterium]
MSKKNDDGAQVVSGNLGNTVQRLRKAYNLSLGELSEQSGVAKSIISAIERNETNPTLSTIWRLSQALDTTIDEVLAEKGGEPFIEHLTKSGLPTLTSEDGKCTMAIIGWLKTVDWVQWYDFKAEPGGVLVAEGHQRGSVENLSVLDGELEVEVDGVKRIAQAGETLRYRCDRPHIIRNKSKEPARATMVCLMQASVMG